MHIMKHVIKEDDIEWEPHPAGHEGVLMKVIRSEEKDNTKSTIASVLVKEGYGVPEHSHEKSDDYLYILGGRAKIKVGDEVYKIEKGSQITVPKQTKHEIFDV
ncbi:MAG: cupin domain-containing protein [Candidatus Saliniplasma sp.]